MRDADDRGILIDGDPAQQVHHDSGALRIERRCWFVSQNNAWPVGQRASNRDALRLPAGEFRRHRMLAVTDLKVVQQLDGARERCRRTQSRELEHHCDIIRGVEERQQIGILENEADLVEPQPAQVALQPAIVINDFAIERDTPGARLHNAGDAVEERRLARTARAHQSDDLARDRRPC